MATSLTRADRCSIISRYTNVQILYKPWNMCKMLLYIVPHSKVHGVNMGPTWILSAPDGPHVDPMNLAIRGSLVVVSPVPSEFRPCIAPDSVKLQYRIWAKSVSAKPKENLRQSINEHSLIIKVVSRPDYFYFCIHPREQIWNKYQNRRKRIL